MLVIVATPFGGSATARGSRLRRRARTPAQA